MLVFHIHSTNTGSSGEKVIFYFQEIVVGNSPQSHIRITSLERDQVAIKIHHHDTGILVESIENYPFFLNGKKIIGTKVLKINDIITIDESSLQLTEANFALSNKTIDLEGTYDTFYTNHQEHETVMTALERELILSDD